VFDVTASDGARLVGEESGEGRALVLVHGITESRAAWDPVVPHLEPAWRVVRVDLRGHGESERRPPYDVSTLAGDLAAVVADRRLDAPLVVGHSLGGVVVAAYAGAGRPARGVVVVDQTLRLGELQAALAPLVPMLRGTPEEFDAAVATVFQVLDGPLPAAERARLDARSSPEPEVVLGVWAPVLDETAEALEDLARDLVRRIRVPFLAIHGTDPGVEYVHWLMGLLPDVRVEVWPDQGHYPHLLDPERFAQRLDQFEGRL
jgi:pimeloyl-ACP methyl ester carboxylesterase